MTRRANAGISSHTETLGPRPRGVQQRRTKHRSARAPIAILAFLLGILLARRAPAEGGSHPFDIVGTDWEGSAEFVQLARRELGDARIMATERIDLARLHPEDSLILLHPEKTLDLGSLARFMRAGGRVILLDDYGRADALLRHFGMDRVPTPRHPPDSVRNDPELPIAEPAGPHPVVTDVRRVVTNHPTGIKHPDLSPILKIRGGPGEPDVFVAVAGAVGQGRLLIVGDPSIVMNSMLRYADNRAFARALVRYAGEDDTWGKRGGHVYIAAGDFGQDGAYGADDSIFTDLSGRLRSLDDVLTTVRHDGFPPWALYAVAVLVGLGVVIWVGANAGRTHRPLVPRFTRPIPLTAQGGVAGRAAVLAAPQTSRALAMLELKSALEEETCGLLHLDQVPAHNVLLEQLAEARLLEPAAIAELRQLLLRMAHVETLVLSRSASAMNKITDNDVMMAAKTIRTLLERARTRAQTNVAGTNMARTNVDGAPPSGPLREPRLT